MAGIYTLFALYFLAISAVMLFGNSMGSYPRMVIWEFDNVFGPLVNMQVHYSKFSGMQNLIGSILTFFVWGEAQEYVTVSILGMFMLWKFFTLEMVYRIATDSHWIFYLLGVLCLTTLIIWRVCRIVQPLYYTGLFIVAGIMILFSLVQWVNICKNATQMKLSIQRC